MIQSQNLRGLVFKSLVIIGLWTIVILLISSITILTTLQEGSSIDFFSIILFEFICISPWIALTPVVIWLARNYKFEKEEIYTSAGVHLFAIVALFAIHSVVQSYTVSQFYDVVFTWEYVKGDFIGFIDMRVMLYAGILLGVYTLDFQRRNREIHLKEPRLKAELNQVKFHALLNQIQPDFLLKSIDSIKESLNGKEEDSEEILTEFSDLLRIMLANVKKDEVILEEDLIAFDLYTNLLKKRLGQDIKIEKYIDEECYDVLMPSFLVLIPLFEQIVDSINSSNSIIHRITYSASIESNRVHLKVTMDGVNIPSKELPKYITNTEILKIVDKYQSRYGDVNFNASTGKNSIMIMLVFPHLRSDNKEQLLDVHSNSKISSLDS